jgi:biopolymer transport protein ExbD
MNPGRTQQEVRATAERTRMAKVRSRFRREMAKAEEEEATGGEINLVPYLDIVVNTVIFLLATISSTVVLANINVNSPRYEEQAVGATAAQPDEDKPKLNLTVAISYTGFIVAGAGGVMTAADGSSPTIKCSVPLQQGRCPAYLATKTTAGGDKSHAWVDRYDYAALTKMLTQIKEKYPQERQAILTGDRLVPYKVVVDTMDALRGRATSKCTGKDGCFFDQILLSAGVQ